MNLVRDPVFMERMRATSELYELAEQLMRQQLRRQYPGESDARIEQRLVDWLQRPRSD
jgi:hypothetical protein